MSKISPNFKREEFACKCNCGFDTVDVDLINVAEVIRAYIGAFSPSSACRCVDWNRKEGGMSNSQHLYGKAIDVPYKDPEMLYNYLDNLYPNKYGLGLYNTFVHVDVRDKKARWDLREKV